MAPASELEVLDTDVRLSLSCWYLQIDVVYYFDVLYSKTEDCDVVWNTAPVPCRIVRLQGQLGFCFACHVKRCSARSATLLLLPEILHLYRTVQIDENIFQRVGLNGQHERVKLLMVPMAKQVWCVCTYSTI